VAAVPAVAVPTTASETPPARWRLLRQVIGLPAGAEWGGLVEAERGLLGAEGLVTGLGLSAQKDGLEGFLEGYVWQKGEGSGEYKQRFRRHWRLQWPRFPDHWSADGLELDLDFFRDVSGLALEGEFAVRLELAALCAPRRKVVAWLDEVERSGIRGLAQAADMACPAPSAGPAPTVVTTVADDYVAGSQAKVGKRVRLPFPEAWRQDAAGGGKDAVRRLVLILRPMTSETGRRPGGALFGRAAAVFVFGPDV